MGTGEVTIGELDRRVDRLERAMEAGFQGLREEIQRLSFVSAAVYAADRSADQERIRRLEADLTEERDARTGAEQAVQQRAWQSRWSLIVALIGLPLSVIGSVLAALLLTYLKP